MKHPALLLLAGTAAFIFGLLHLFQLRFAAGDIYPAYSSLRSDPLGVKILFKSLDHLIPARRNFQPLSKLDHGRQTALFYLGAQPDNLNLFTEDLRNLEAFVSTGGRLLASLHPSYPVPPSQPAIPTPTPTPTSAPPLDPDERNSDNSSPSAQPSPDQSPPNQSPPPDPKAAQPKAAPEKERTPVSVAPRWGFKIAHKSLPRTLGGRHDPATAFPAPASDLHDPLTCHSSLHFEDLTPAWRVIYARENDLPVLIERDLGDGTIVLCADSFFLSNEALWNDRQPELLAWLVGSSQRVIFDETHLGVGENPGVANLLRRYRLHGLFAGLFLLAALFVWKNSLSFIPPHPDLTRQEDSNVIEGKESSAGFINLLRRSIPSREILAVCLTEWQKSAGKPESTSRLRQIQDTLDQENQLALKDRRPVQTYRTICRILSRKKTALSPPLKTSNSTPHD